MHIRHLYLCLLLLILCHMCVHTDTLLPLTHTGWWKRINNGDTWEPWLHMCLVTWQLFQESWSLLMHFFWYCSALKCSFSPSATHHSILFFLKKKNKMSWVFKTSFTYNSGLIQHEWWLSEVFDFHWFEALFLKSDYCLKKQYFSFQFAIYELQTAHFLPLCSVWNF